MEELEHFGGASLGLLRERRAALLACQAGVAELLHLAEQWESADEVVARHLAERGEVDVPDTSVPNPRILAARHTSRAMVTSITYRCPGPRGIFASRRISSSRTDIAPSFTWTS